MIARVTTSHVASARGGDEPPRRPEAHFAHNPEHLLDVSRHRSPPPVRSSGRTRRSPPDPDLDPDGGDDYENDGNDEEEDGDYNEHDCVE